MKRGKNHQLTGALRPRRTAFDLSYEKKFTCDFGELIPVMCDEVVPGDFFRIRTQTVVRTQPMFAPLLHEVKLTVHYFYVPYRLLMDDWESFISRGPDGRYIVPVPMWPVPMRYRASNNTLVQIPSDVAFGKNSLWDYFGFPLYGTGAPYHFNPINAYGSNNMPIAFPLRAYNLTWDEFFRDENLQALSGKALWSDIRNPSNFSRSDLDLQSNTFSDRAGKPNLRNWVKDYFTSALPWQQRGPTIAFDVQGNIPVSFDQTGSVSDLGKVQGYVYNMNSASGNPRNPLRAAQASGSTPSNYIAHQNNSNSSTINDEINYPRVGPASVDLGAGVSFTITEFRHAFQLQKWMERNARGGVRYVEFLRSHFGVFPRDDRLQRPEYIGGATVNLTVSEVLQTSNSAGIDVGNSSNTPQGNMSGHGMMAGSADVGRYFSPEYGLILGLMSIMPTPSYEDGIDRQWLRRMATDFYFPEFVNLSEQGIYNGELFATGGVEDSQTWAFQPQYDEMRIKRNQVCGEMRVNSGNNISFWHLGRAFTQLPPLSSTFVRLNPAQFNDRFAVEDFKHFIVSHANIIHAVRPLPYIGEPGLIDHH